MKIRFKLRTLLVAITLVAVLFGLQVHVHNKAARFVERTKKPSAEVEDQLNQRSFEKISEYRFVEGKVEPLSFQDVLYFKRRCELTFFGAYDGSFGLRHSIKYGVPCFGEVDDYEVVQSTFWND